VHTRGIRHGFTLIELVVVVVLTAIIAGVILPRLMRTDEREARIEAEAVASLVGSAARRGAVSAQRVALEFIDGRFQGVMLRNENPGSFDEGDVVWAPDPFLPTLRLVSLSLAGASADGATLGDREWRVELGGQGRPELLLVLEDSRGGRWTVLLAGDADGAVAFAGEALPEGYAQRTVDLDRTGRGLAPW
jgi:prepilin-type N-terminal cleavage/methylation domain-containing protein